MQIRVSIALVVVIVFPGLFLGCAYHEKNNHFAEALLSVGDTVVIEFQDLPDPSTKSTMHPQKISFGGMVQLPLGAAVSISGLTCAYAATKIPDVYVPKYYGIGRLRVTVTKVQPDGAANAASPHR